LIWAVVDTNTLVSGMLRGGLPGQIVDFALEARFIMVTSRALLDELARVVQYPKFSGYFEDPLSTVLLVEHASVVVEPTARVALVDDESDNRVIEAALASNAAYIVTGDRLLLELGRCNGTQIVTPRQFLDALGVRTQDE
jgi:putative PIN family toxin of toxin-antitoxin system